MRKTIFLNLVLGIFLFITSNILFSDNSTLEVYGQRIFSEISAIPTKPATYVLDEYILGAGDEIVVNIWGSIEQEQRQEIENDGAIFISGIGKIYLEGKSLKEAKDIIRKNITNRYKNVSFAISTGKLRKIEIFVLGEVKKPGSYVISPMSNVLEIISMAGGTLLEGSLRRIRVIRRRDGQSKEYDLYPLLMSGKILPEIQFFQGDMLFIPISEFMVGIKGAVKRQGIYEITGSNLLDDLLKLSGGFLPNADISRIQVERPDMEKGRVLIDIDYGDIKKFQVKNLDTINIPFLPETIFYKIYLEGAVRAPGSYGWKAGLKLSDILKESELSPYALKDKAEVVRTEKNGAKTIIIISPEKLFEGDKDADIELSPQDKIIVYSQERREKKVLITGQIYYPGEYIVVRGERLSDLVKRAGGVTKYAYLPGIIFLRESVKQEKEKQLEVFLQEKEAAIKQEKEKTTKGEEKQLLEEGMVFLKQLKESDVKGRVVLKIEDEETFSGGIYDIFLEDGDSIVIPEKPIFVSIMGEVNLPANVIYKQEYQFKDYLAKAGGFAKNADKRNIFISKIDGTAIVGTDKIEPGDTLVVPFEAKERRGSIFKDIVQMFYHISLGVAAY